MEAGADILLFAGGDGTARDILDVVGDRLPLVGIPAGVKMHSAVFALSPEAAGETVAVMARQPSGSPVRLRLAEIMDADEAQRAGATRRCACSGMPACLTCRDFCSPRRVRASAAARRQSRPLAENWSRNYQGDPSW